MLSGGRKRITCCTALWLDAAHPELCLCTTPRAMLAGHACTRSMEMTLADCTKSCKVATSSVPCHQVLLCQPTQHGHQRRCI